MAYFHPVPSPGASSLPSVPIHLRLPHTIPNRISHPWHPWAPLARLYHCHALSGQHGQGWRGQEGFRVSSSQPPGQISVCKPGAIKAPSSPQGLTECTNVQCLGMNSTGLAPALTAPGSQQDPSSKPGQDGGRDPNPGRRAAWGTELICPAIRRPGQLLCDCGQVSHLSEHRPRWGHCGMSGSRPGRQMR